MTAIDTDLISPRATPADAAAEPPPGYARRMRSVVYVQGMFNVRHLEHVYRLFGGDLVLSIVLSEIVQHHRPEMGADLSADAGRCGQYCYRKSRSRIASRRDRD